MHESTNEPGGSRPDRVGGLLNGQLEALMAWREAAERRGAPRPPDRSVLGRELDGELDQASRVVEAAAVVAHPDPRQREEIARHLRRHGVEVVVLGAGPAGFAPAGTPAVDLVLLHVGGDVSPVPVVAAARAAHPRALVGVQTDLPDAGPALLEAGARAVFSSGVAAAEVAAALVSCLRGERGAILLL